MFQTYVGVTIVCVFLLSQTYHIGCLIFCWNHMNEADLRFKEKDQVTTA